MRRINFMSLSLRRRPPASLPACVRSAPVCQDRTAVQTPAERLKPPVTPLVGEAVQLRPLSDEDEAAVYSACQDSEIQRWTSVPSPYSSDDARSYIDFSKRALAGRLDRDFFDPQ
jgi:hypothetical protein